jgi:hypothetical protein
MRQVGIVSLKRDYPAPIASWAESSYVDSQWLEEQWERGPDSGPQLALASLKAMEGSEGDPLRFLDDEGTYICEHAGQVGLLQELELEATFNYPNEPVDPDREVSIAQFDRIVTFKKLLLEEILERFPHTKFFVSYADVTYKGCICLNAFTPLEHARCNGEAVLLSPYSKEKSLTGPCPTLKKISELMRTIQFLEFQ